MVVATSGFEAAGATGSLVAGAGVVDVGMDADSAG